MADERDEKLMEKFNPSHPNNCASEWEDYKRSFQIFLDSKGLHEANGRRKVGQLLKCMGVDHIRTYDTFTWAPGVPAVQADPDAGIEAVPARPAEDKYHLETVFTKFDAQFGVHRFRSIKRQEFLSIERGENEGVMKFIANLKRAARHCSYGDREEEFVCDMVINRVRDRACTEKLMELSDDDLTLNNVIKVCRQVELTRTHLEHLDEEKSVHQYGSGRGGKRQFKPQCPKCMRHHDPTWCRADNSVCSACGDTGHFMKSKLCPLNQAANRGRGRGRGGRGRGRGRGTQRHIHQTEEQLQEEEDDAEGYEEEQFENVL